MKMPLGKIHIVLLPDFHLEEDAVLVAADTSGIDELETALTQAELSAPGALTIHLGCHNHTFIVDGPEDRIELGKDDVMWRLSEGKRKELVEKLAAMKSTPGPAHQYIDITGQATILVLSRDEYLDLFCKQPETAGNQ
jgi:hypothetical protein